jgi:radical SAM-linked protein
MEPTKRLPVAPGGVAKPSDIAEPVGAVEPSRAIPPAEPRQRWRVRFRRRADAPPLPQREQLAAWEASLVAGGLPLVGLDLPIPRPRIVVAVPLGVGMAAEGELVDLFLVDRRTVDEVRAALAASLPAGHELVDLHDVWLGEPSLSGRVIAADYRLEVARIPDTPDRATLETAIGQILRASTLPRTRDKGGRSVAYDLRPLLAGIDVLPATPEEPTTLLIRTRFDPERGVGRPEEAFAAIAERIGVPLEIGSIVRERLILAGDD